MYHQPGPMITHSAQTAPRTAVTTVVFSTELKEEKKKKNDNKLNSFPARSLRVGQVKFNPLLFFFSLFFLFLPVRNLLEANKDAEGRRSEIFQVSLGG